MFHKHAFFHPTVGNFDVSPTHVGSGSVINKKNKRFLEIVLCMS